MKKILTVIFLACAFVFAQEGSIKPEFQAFSGALIKLKKAEHGFHKFRLRVDVAPWSFLAEGEVQVPALRTAFQRCAVVVYDSADYIHGP